MKLLLAILCAFLLLVSCHSKKIMESKTNPEPNQMELTVDEPRDSTSILPIQIDKNVDLTGFQDPYTLINAEIKDGLLWLQTSYVGGCREHEFKMVFNGTHVPRQDQETGVSVWVSLKLGHNGNGDVCRSIVKQNIRFDLKPLQKEGGNNLIIRLSNWGNELVYSF